MLAPEPGTNGRGVAITVDVPRPVDPGIVVLAAERRDVEEGREGSGGGAVADGGGADGNPPTE